MYKKWNKKLMDKQIKELNSLKSEDTKYTINQLKILKNDMRNMVFPKLTFEETITSDIETIKRFTPFLEDTLRFATLELDYDREKIRKHIFSNLKIDINTLLSYTIDFYYFIDKDFWKSFKNTFKNRKDNLMFSKNRSITHYINELDYNYLNIYYDKSLDSIFEIIHEYGHVITNSLNKNLSYYSNPFVELIPLTMELLMVVEGSKITGINNKKFMVYLIYLTKGMINQAFASALWIKYIPFASNIYNQNICFKELKEMFNLNDKETSMLFDTSNNETLNYVIPFIVAIEIVYMYIEDKEKAIYTLKELIKSNDDNYLGVLEKNNTIINEHSTKLVKDLNNKRNPFK